MKIKNKFKYIFVFGIVFAILITLSINIFADNSNYYYYNSDGSGATIREKVIITNCDVYKFNNTEYSYGQKDNYQIYQIIQTDKTNSSYRGSKVSIGYNDSEINVYNPSLQKSSNKTYHVYVKFYNNSTIKVNYRTGSAYESTQSGYGQQMQYNTEYNVYDGMIVCLFGYTQVYYSGYYYKVEAYTYIHFESGITSQPLNKTYNTGTFYNSGDEYNQIQVIGMSSDNSIFESITSIDYINTVTTARDTVYSGSVWNGNYSNILSYYYGDTAPNITSLNSDLNSLITFTTNVMASNLTLDFNTGQFYNNNGSYTSISVTGTTLNGSTFNSITIIAYKDTSQSIVDTAYNGGWNSGFSSQLSYYANQNAPTISSINSACNNIITFTLYAIPVSYQNTFVTGNFINAGDIYNRIDIIGTSSDNSTFLTITSIDYVDTNTNARDTVYSNGTWNGNYNNTLLYYSTMSQPNISAVNNATNGIITFSVSLYSGSYEKTYNLTFYNNNNLYSSIKLIGTTSDNVKFNTINTIYYGNEPVYINGWEQGFSSVLVQYDFMNELDLSQINLDSNSIIVFTKIHVDSVDPSIKNNMLEGVQVIFYPITSFIGLAQTSFPIAVILIMNVVGLVAVVIFSFVKRNKE